MSWPCGHSLKYQELIGQFYEWLGQAELTSKGQRIGNVNIKEDSLSPLLFVVALIPLTLVLRKCEAGYSYRNNIKINHLLFLDDLYM